MKLTRRRVLGLGVAAGVGAGAYKLLRGLEDSSDDVEQIPADLRRSALDVHVHVLGIGTGGSGCWMHPDMRSSLSVRAGLWNLRLRFTQPNLDQAYVSYLLTRIHRSGFLRQAVVLAQDWTYTHAGERDDARTPFYTPNSYVAQLARAHGEFLFGASIHPYRPDALDALDRAAAEGAVLVKWIPNVQGIDLADPRCRAFYRRLAHHRIALLPHMGDEQAMFVAGQHFGDPRTLAAPLEEGVTVIAAHVASLGERDGRSNFEWLAELLPKWPNLYADTSALTLLTRWRSLLQLARRPDLQLRLVHGSDFPLPPASTLFAGRIPASRLWNAWKRENPLRRDFEIKEGVGLSHAIYTRGYQVLAPRLPPAR
jgi:predicted TIM-barrel fold metal-dependent hydrolase